MSRKTKQRTKAKQRSMSFEQKNTCSLPTNHKIPKIKKNQSKTNSKEEIVKFDWSPKHTRSKSNIKSNHTKNISAEAKVKIDWSPKHTRSKSNIKSNHPENISAEVNVKIGYSAIKTRSKSKINPNNSVLPNSSGSTEQKLPKSSSKQLTKTEFTFVKLNDFKIDCIVLARQKNSFPWPARVLNIEKNRTFVYFFGDKRSGHVANSEIYDFILSGIAIKSTLQSRKKFRGYLTGLAEVEMLLCIPSEQSLLN